MRGYIQAIKIFVRQTEVYELEGLLKLLNNHATPSLMGGQKTKIKKMMERRYGCNSIDWRNQVTAKQQDFVGVYISQSAYRSLVAYTEKR